MNFRVLKAFMSFNKKKNEVSFYTVFSLIKFRRLYYKQSLNFTEFFQKTFPRFNYQKKYVFTYKVQEFIL